MARHLERTEGLGSVIEPLQHSNNQPETATKLLLRWHYIWGIMEEDGVDSSLELRMSQNNLQIIYG